MKQTRQNKDYPNHLQYIDALDMIVNQSPPSVMVKARFLGETIRGMYFPPSDYTSFVNVNHINENYEVIEPREYVIYYSEKNTKVQPL
jgi:hypothetical protein